MWDKNFAQEIKAGVKKAKISSYTTLIYIVGNGDTPKS